MKWRNRVVMFHAVEYYTGIKNEFTRITYTNGFPRRLIGKESACQCRRHGRLRFDPWVGKIPWKRKWQHTPVFLPRRSHGQRRLVASVHEATKDLDTTRRLSTQADVHRHKSPKHDVEWERQTSEGCGQYDSIYINL